MWLLKTAPTLKKTSELHARIVDRALPGCWIQFRAVEPGGNRTYEIAGINCGCIALAELNSGRSKKRRLLVGGNFCSHAFLEMSTVISGIGVRGAIDLYGFESRLSVVEFIRIVAKQCVSERRSRSCSTKNRSSVTVEEHFQGAGAVCKCFRSKC